MKQLAVYASALLIVLTPVLVVPGCSKSSSSDDDLIGNWLLSYDFGGTTRSEAVSFTINDKVYIATGQSNRDRYSDIWEFDLTKKYWTSRSAMPAAAGVRSSGVGFAVKGYGYVATGFDGNAYLGDVWRFDPAANAWNTTPLNPFGGGARRDAVAFTIGDRAYIASGYNDNYLDDCWEYNPDADSWTQKASIGSKRAQSTAFVYNNQAYLVSGESNGAALTDIRVYNASDDSWSTKAKLTNATDDSFDDDYTGIARYNAANFVLNGKAYLVTGSTGGLTSSVWEYDIATDRWKQKTGFSGTAREGAIAFALGGRLFVTTGRSGSQPYDNGYEFQPDAEDNDDDNN